MSAYELTTKQNYLDELAVLKRPVARQLNETLSALQHEPLPAGSQTRFLADGTQLQTLPVREYTLYYSIADGEILLWSIRRGLFDETDMAAAAAVADAAVTAAAAAPALPAEPPTGSALLPLSMVLAGPPPRMTIPPNDDALAEWQIPHEYWPCLRGVTRADQLVGCRLPLELHRRLQAALFPADLQSVAEQPTLLVEEIEDFERVRDNSGTRLLLRLDEQQQQLAVRRLSEPLLLRGGPGSGKTLVLLHRTAQLVRAGIQPILFTSYTRVLVNYARALLRQILDDPAQLGLIEFRTVDALMRRGYQDLIGPVPQTLNDHELAEVISEAYQDLISAAEPAAAAEIMRLYQRYGSSWLVDEFTRVIEEHDLNGETYLTFVRSGREDRLLRSERPLLWQLFNRTRELLTRRQCSSWEGIRLATARAAAARPIASEQRRYRALIIDEAQDLSPNALHYLLTLVREPPLVSLAADAAQAIYRKQFSWGRIQQGLRGQTATLTQAYRTTAAIAAAAQPLITSGDTPEQTPLTGNERRRGTRPLLCFTRFISDEAAAIAAFFRRETERLGLPFGRCAVLCHDRRHASDLERILRHKHGLPIKLVDPETLDPDSAEIKLTTLHSGKGLEFAIVAIARLAAGSFPYDLSRRPAEEHDELLAQQRRLLYVGCTRATHALLVSAAREEPSQFTELLQEPLWQHVLA
jgi:superfamily I DNA/RNA helicase